MEAPRQRPAAPKAQQRLDLEKGRKEAEAEDDQMLDIPAFLRRQTN